MLLAQAGLDVAASLMAGWARVACLLGLLPLASVLIVECLIAGQQAVCDWRTPRFWQHHIETDDDLPQ